MVDKNINSHYNSREQVTNYLYKNSNFLKQGFGKILIVDD